MIVTFYSTSVFTLNYLLHSKRQSFLSLLFGAQTNIRISFYPGRIKIRPQSLSLNDDFFVIFRGKSNKRHSTDKISRHSLCSRIFGNENIPRSAAPCRQLPLDSRGMCKFGRANGASENLYIISAPLCGRCL